MTAPVGVSYADKDNPQPIPGGHPGAWTTLQFLDRDRIEVAGNRTIVHLQAAAELPVAVADRPTSVELRVMRYVASEVRLDPTGMETRCVAPKTKQSWLYTVEMDTDPDTPLSIECRHDGRLPIVLRSRIVKVQCYLQQVIGR